MLIRWWKLWSFLSSVRENYLEWTGATDTMKTYYYAGATRAAMREGSSLYYLLGDHLGSTSVVTDPGGVILSATRYDPWGELRAVSGPSQTSYGYTGQRAEKGLGLYFYGARFYDPYLNRWIQPDTIIPDQYNSTDWDRYSYVRNNPVKFTDSTGHFVDPVTLAIGGAVVGFVGNIGFQMIGSYLAGNSDNVSEAFASVDWKEACTYGVAGAVAGATYGAINPMTTIAGASLAGAVSGAVSGQVAGLFDATWDATANVMSGG